MKKYSFEKLEAWQDSRSIGKEVYLITKDFPDYERFGLVSQMQRSSISVSSNLAEGSSRTSFKDQAHFTQIAYSSLIELLNQLILALDLGFIQEEKYIKLRNQIEILTGKLGALRKSQLNRHNPKP